MPPNYKNMSATQLFDTFVGSHQETATVPYAFASERLIAISFVSTADDCFD